MNASGVFQTSGGGGKLRYQEFTASGTFTPSAALLAAGAIREEGDALVLSNLRFGGATFADLAVQEVEADGPKDTRPSHHSDFLRLGAAFLSTHPTLWNFPAGTITVLRPDSGFLAAR